jgi:hypothetical protein
MDKRIQENPKNIHCSLYHHGLVKIIIMEELKQRSDDWDMFLSRNGFVNGEGPHGKIP